MNCKQTESSLIAFHWGTIENTSRLALESHLLSCPSCLKVYFAIKCNLESGGDDRPSEKARLKLRSAIAEELKPRPRQSPWHAPLAFGLAASLVLASTMMLRVLTPDSGVMPKHLQDNRLVSP